MYTIKIAGYSIFELLPNLSTGRPIKGTNVTRFVKGMTFNSVYGGLRYISQFLGTAYHKFDWCFEEDVDGEGTDAWVLHIIVEKGTMKFASQKMIENWQKRGNPKLVDLIVNVVFEVL